MTRNLDKWRFRTKDIVSPDSWIDLSFYFLVGAALQRRVWLAHDKHPVFANLYVIFVGPPAVGKTFIIKEVASALQHHPYRPPNSAVEPTEENLQNYHEAALVQANQMYNELATTKMDRKRINARPLLFPVAADATTYEALLGALARSGRAHQYTVLDAKTRMEVKKFAPMTCSLCFCLEEISSLFKRNREEVARLLLNTYDCGDYTYDTKTQGTDLIKRCCVSMLGGTTPSFMKEAYSDKILTDGFASRGIFAFEQKNRFNKLYIEDVTAPQLQAQLEILNHLKLLANLYGRATLSPDAEEFLKIWWEQDLGKRVNHNTKLDGYYGRKNLHVMKMAMAVHFADNLSMEISIDECVRAIEILEKVEKNMHLSFSYSGRNPLSDLTRSVLHYMEIRGEATPKDLILEFYEEMESPRDDMSSVLNYLTDTKQKLRFDGTTYKLRGPN